MSEPSVADRLMAGDFLAFSDPELPLRLLAEPNAEWWTNGSFRCATNLTEQLVLRVRDAEGRAALERHLPVLVPDVEEAFDLWCDLQSPLPQRPLVAATIEAMNAAYFSTTVPVSAVASFARALRELAMEPPPAAWDDALAALERLAALGRG